MLDARYVKQFEDWIRARSYGIWEREGRIDGHAEEHWLRAEKEIEAEWQAAMKGENIRFVPPRPAITTPPVHRVSGRFEAEPFRHAA